MARYDYHLENGSAERTDDVAFGGEDEGDSEGDDEGGNSLMAMEDSGLNKKRQFHKEYTELKKAILSLERERLAGHKARRDREEQALEEHRRAERRMKEEEMEYR
ncbi:hypothetical protein C348_00887 [Cryptococcus neoformans Gb118]|nr:hypothetical protein C348_00887 [Cryptococcus neoformans var. grubii Gb118]